MSRPFQTDALTYAPGPSSSLGQPRSLASSSRPFDVRYDKSNPGARYEADLKGVHEDWNIKIDREVKGLAKGLRDLVDLVDIGNNPTSTPSPLPLQLRLSSLIRSTQNLRDMTHELKLLLLLSDQTSSVSKRDSEVRAVREEVERMRGQVGEEIVQLFGGRPGNDIPEDAVQRTDQSVLRDEAAGPRNVKLQEPSQAAAPVGQPERTPENEDEEMEEV